MENLVAQFGVKLQDVLASLRKGGKGPGGYRIPGTTALFPRTETIDTQ